MALAPQTGLRMLVEMARQRQYTLGAAAADHRLLTPRQRRKAKREMSVHRKGDREPLH
jgi:hypothetical protein